MELISTILASLSKGNFLETDGTTYWWVDEGKYNVIYAKTFQALISKKLIYPKRIDDETTCYYMQGKENKTHSEISGEKPISDYQIDKIRSFINT